MDIELIVEPGVTETTSAAWSANAVCASPTGVVPFIMVPPLSAKLLALIEIPLASTSPLRIL